MALFVVAGLALGLVGPVGAQPRTQPGEVRHSGRIVELAPDGSGIVLEEMVAWTGPGTGLVKRSLRLTPSTSIRVVEQTDRWDGAPGAMPGWDAQPIDAGGLRPGDYVTVTTDDDRQAVAVALQVVRPAGSAGTRP